VEVTLEAPVIGLVLLAALLHASWNAITKASGDPMLTLWVVTFTGSVIGGVATLFVDFPHRDAWPYLAGSMALHFAYEMFLVSAYRLGDLSQVYPIARGLAPCIVAVPAAVFAGEVLDAGQSAGLAIAAISIGSLARSGRGAGGAAVAVAAGTGLLIAGYTFVDGQGVRLGGDPFNFIAWSFFLHALPFTVVVLVLRRRRFASFLRTGARPALAGGAMATLAYAIVLWALARGGMAHVSALRETSVVIAALIGTRLMGEPFGARRVAAAGGVVLGIALMQLS
jgi:drug/metabolite transporter (DMT)-like permease